MLIDRKDLAQHSASFLLTLMLLKNPKNLKTFSDAVSWQKGASLMCINTDTAFSILVKLIFEPLSNLFIAQ